MLKGKSFKIIITVISAVFILFSLTGCDNKKSTDVNKEKVNEEMELLDDKIISSLNLLNNISFANYKVIADDASNENREEGQTTNEQGSNENKANGESSGKQESSEEGTNKKDENEKSSNSEGSSEKGQNEEPSDEEDPNRKSKDEGSSSKKDAQSREENGSKLSQGEQEKGKIYRLTEQNILQSSSESDIRWNEIQSEVESLYTIWTTIKMDLKSENINNKDILEFNKLLDSLAKAVKEKNKKDSLNNLSKIYNLIPIYMSQYSRDDIKASVYKVKSYLVNACCMVENRDWSNIRENINMAKNEFENVVNKNNDENKKLNINRAEIQLEDFQNSLSEEDKEIFFLKYRNLIQELNML